MIYPAFLIGLLGSLHCIGMCGPIALTVGVQSGQSPVKKAVSLLLYNIGRAVTYAALGLLLGLVGFGFKVAGLQQSLSILIGIMLIVYALWPRVIHRMERKSNMPLVKFNVWLKRSLGTLLKGKQMYKPFVLGMLNGLLPCGLVYFAIAGAIAVGSPIQGMFFMIAFAAGTFPLMLIFGWVGGMAGAVLKKRILKAVPVLMFVMGVLFVLRGLDLNIPYLSPALSSFSVGSDAAICH